MKKLYGTFTIFLLGIASGYSDIILGGDTEVATPREDITKARVLAPEALRQDSPDASVKQGIFSPAIKYGERAGKIHETGSRQTALVETMEAQQQAEGKSTPAASSSAPPTGKSHIITLGNKAVQRIYANPFSPNILSGHEKNAVLQSSVGTTISGGGDEFFPNKVAGDYGTVGGGLHNQAGGVYQYLEAPFATISGGKSNQALRRGTTVCGGIANRAEGLSSTIAGGQNNFAKGAFTLIGGGHLNATFADYATVAGGHTNQAIAKAATASGGEFNRANGVGSTIAGGLHNETKGKYAAIPGGSLNKAEGKNTLAAGNQAQALHDGAFVWSDSRDEAFASTAPNQFLIQAEGNVGIDTPNPQEKLTVNGNIAPSEHNVAKLGSSTAAFSRLHLQGTLDFQNQVNFQSKGTRVMMIDQRGDLVIAGNVYASNFSDHEGRPIGGATIDEVADVLALELHAIKTELAQRDQTIAAQRALIDQMEQRLRTIEVRTGIAP